MEETHICVVDRDGGVVHETRVASTPADIDAALMEAPILGVERLEADICDAAAVLAFLDRKSMEMAIQEGFWVEILDAAAAEMQQGDN
jgi:hypothetical protein